MLVRPCFISLPSQHVVLVLVVTDESVATEAVTRMAPASAVVVEQVSRQRLTRIVHRQRNQGMLHSVWQGKRSSSLRRERSSGLNWMIHKPVLFDMCR